MDKVIRNIFAFFLMLLPATSGLSMQLSSSSSLVSAKKDDKSLPQARAGQSQSGQDLLTLQTPSRRSGESDLDTSFLADSINTMQNSASTSSGSNNSLISSSSSSEIPTAHMNSSPLAASSSSNADTTYGTLPIDLSGFDFNSFLEPIPSGQGTAAKTTDSNSINNKDKMCDETSQIVLLQSNANEDEQRLMAVISDPTKIFASGDIDDLCAPPLADSTSLSAVDNATQTSVNTTSKLGSNSNSNKDASNAKKFAVPLPRSKKERSTTDHTAAIPKKNKSSKITAHSSTSSSSRSSASSNQKKIAAARTKTKKARPKVKEVEYDEEHYDKATMELIKILQSSKKDSTSEKQKSEKDGEKKNETLASMGQEPAVSSSFEPATPNTQFNRDLASLVPLPDVLPSTPLTELQPDLSEEALRRVIIPLTPRTPMNSADSSSLFAVPSPSSLHLQGHAAQTALAKQESSSSSSLTGVRPSVQSEPQDKESNDDPLGIGAPVFEEHEFLPVYDDEVLNELTKDFDEEHKASVNEDIESKNKKAKKQRALLIELLGNGQSFQCQFGGCNFLCTEPHNLKIHVAQHLKRLSKDEQQKRCNLCGKKSDSVDKLTKHKEEHLKFKCPTCGYRTSQLNQIYSHYITRHTQIKPYKCKICGEEMSYISYFNKHGTEECERYKAKLKIQNDYDEEHYTKSMQTLIDLLQSKGDSKAKKQESHTLRISVPTCQDDDSIKTNKTSESDDIESKNRKAKKQRALLLELLRNGQSFKCKFAGCESFLTEPYYLERHVGRHLKTLSKNEQQTRCNLCGEKSDSGDTLTKHKEEHLGLKCHTCGKSKFNSAHHLLEHFITIHTQIKPYKCKICGITFTCLRLLNSHKKNPAECEKYKTKLKKASMQKRTTLASSSSSSAMISDADDSAKEKIYNSSSLSTSEVRPLQLSSTMLAPTLVPYLQNNGSAFTGANSNDGTSDPTGSSSSSELSSTRSVSNGTPLLSSPTSALALKEKEKSEREVKASAVLMPTLHVDLSRIDDRQYRQWSLKLKKSLPNSDINQLAHRYLDITDTAYSRCKKHTFDEFVDLTKVDRIEGHYYDNIINKIVWDRSVTREITDTFAKKHSSDYTIQINIQSGWKLRTQLEKYIRKNITSCVSDVSASMNPEGELVDLTLSEPVAVKQKVQDADSSMIVDPTREKKSGTKRKQATPETEFDSTNIKKQKMVAAEQTSTTNTPSVQCATTSINSSSSSSRPSVVMDSDTDNFTTTKEMFSSSSSSRIFNPRLQCELCKDSFAALNVLKRHKYYHEEPAKFPCKHCKVRFNTSRSCQSHVQKCVKLRNFANAASSSSSSSLSVPAPHYASTVTPLLPLTGVSFQSNVSSSSATVAHSTASLPSLALTQANSSGLLVTTALLGAGRQGKGKEKSRT